MNDTATVFTIGEDDTARPLRVQAVIEDPAGIPVPYPNLLGATVKFSMRLASNPAAVPIVNAADAIVENAALGYLRYEWAAADTAVPGVYDAEFHGVDSNGDVFTVPNARKIRVIVVENARA